MRLTQIIESLLFASDAPLSATDLARVDERLDEDTVEAVIEELRAEYELSDRSFQIYEVAGGFQLLTRPEFVSVLERYDSVPQPSRLSAPALEVLAIIAYRQPLGRAEIEDIRGVGSSGVLRTLQERSLIEPVARGEGLGRPLLYGTTKKFLEHCGFRSLEDLPRPDELPVVLRDRTVIAALPLDDDATEASPDAPRADSEPRSETESGGSEAIPTDEAPAAAEDVSEGDAAGDDASENDAPVDDAPVDDAPGDDAYSSDISDDHVFDGDAPAADVSGDDALDSSLADTSDRSDASDAIDDVELDEVSPRR
jgi:segregation and condensation protein B